jgi:mannose/fructose/N-acetylgalactosamine-specific phosphotransferase system component IIC
MAEIVTIDGHQYKKRNPLGVLGLSFLTLGVYFFVWYYKINDELRRAENDEGISPTRSLMAMIFGWLIIVPPFIAMYNTAKHVQSLETRRGVGQTVEPALTVVLMFLFSFGNGIYVQEHLNRAWGASAARMQVPTDPGLVPTGA